MTFCKEYVQERSKILPTGAIKNHSIVLVGKHRSHYNLLFQRARGQHYVLPAWLYHSVGVNLFVAFCFSAVLSLDILI